MPIQLCKEVALFSGGMESASRNGARDPASNPSSAFLILQKTVRNLSPVEGYTKLDIFSPKNDRSEHQRCSLAFETGQKDLDPAHANFIV